MKICLVHNAHGRVSGEETYPPNRMAIDFLRGDEMPPLLEHIPDAQLVITGGDIPRRDPWLITPGIVPHDELPALLSSCQVAGAPVFSGSGTRLKILEAMAPGVPVVATSKGAVGLPFRNGEHLLIADNAAAFVQSLQRAISDPAMCDRLRSRAMEAVRQQFDWPQIAGTFTSDLRKPRVMSTCRFRNGNSEPDHLVEGAPWTH